MVPVVLAITSRIAWFGGGVSFGVRTAWLLAAIAAGTLVFAAVALVLGGSEVRAVRVALRRRLAARPR